jgi:hypothetical protein
MARFLRRSGGGKVPPLVPIPPIAELPAAKLQASARYLGTFTVPVGGGTGERVVGQSLAARSAARLSLSAEALDVVRIAGSFRIRTTALRGARTAEQFRGKPVTDLLLVRWEHEGHQWETGFRLDPARSIRDAAKAPIAGGKGATRPDAAGWVRTISKLARANTTSDESRGTTA